MYGDARLPGRFWDRVSEDAATGCWVWKTPSRDGYGRQIVHGREYLAHRLAYDALVGGLPDWTPGGMQLDHLCRVRACVNPAHLELVEQRVNSARGAGPKNAGVAARLSTGLCTRGHNDWRRDLEKPDTWHCRECSRERNRRNMSVVRDARNRLGLSSRSYMALFTRSTRVARDVLERLSRGESPESIIFNARGAEQ